ncbi:cytochrome c-type biogenesis CcmF C-terminal domain-containing protein, partial [Dyella sp. ASV21]|uniref:cytochrome c-type biogenesis CcmF C-terminal domain-containing protein n=1 Tax=Dyella sp. ASV21 TaxID=2795114 RepID=UPI0027153B63
MSLLKRVLWRAGLAALACAIVAALVTSGESKAIAGTAAAVWCCFGTLLYVFKRWREMPAGRRYPAEMAGMLLAHFGVGVFLAGVLLTNALSVERDVRMAPGQTESIGGYAFRFDGVQETTGPNWQGDQGTVTVLRNGNEVAVMHPQKRTYTRGQVQTESAIAPGLFRDLYVALGEPMDRQHPDGAWALRLYDKPFVRWIWAGGLLMMLGGFFAAADRRFRAKRVAEASPVATPVLQESRA